MKSFAYIFLLPFVLGGCASTDKPDPNRFNPAGYTGAESRTVRNSLAKAATRPLDDFSFRRDAVPETLENLGYIYQANPRPNCAAITRELLALGQALGELDEDDETIQRTWYQQRLDVAADTAIDAVRSGSSSLVPFSGIVRTATGANAARTRHDAKFDRGRRRRAFLKGYALGIGCRPPAAPKILDGLPPAHFVHPDDAAKRANNRRRGNRN
ncbi:MAG: hypothetical protein COA47_02305 [Robiginitomaculum sp.]|nr:MAG: hypothetical protein COA47_02305 [Robiginitomaculum sp.]